jgi:UDP-N-acetylglucosamine 1-carboxyvinyltransferase
MNSEYILIDQSLGLRGQVDLTGAKNSVLVVMASLILAPGKSRLFNVPCLDDVHQMIALLKNLGAVIQFDQVNNILDIDTSTIMTMQVSADIMKKMRASILVMGPLLARFKRAQVALPGGCILGARPIDFHLKAFGKMGAEITFSGDFINAQAQALKPGKFVLEYPSVGATENIMMAAVLTFGITKIVNAAIEPEVLDLIDVLRKMGAHITVQAPATIEIRGVSELKPIEHTIMYDRLEAGSLILATAITGGELYLPHAPVDFMEVFLTKLEDMGHTITVGPNGQGMLFKATKNPVAVSFKTMPYPGFPTDLQAPMMAALCLASGTSIVQETVYENRLLHVRELQKMGAQISIEGDTATIKGVDQLYGAHVIATDIRASCALLLAGLAAQGQTHMTGVHHVRRGYQGIVEKINMLGGKVAIKSDAL